MKTYFFSALFFSFLAMSCTTDEQLTEQDNVEASSVNNNSLYAKGAAANNGLNQYDIAGKLFYELSDSYYASHITNSDIAAHVDNIAAENILFQSISTGYTGISQTQVASVLENGDDTNALVSSTTMSPVAKAVLNNFILLLQTEDVTYNSLYNAILDFEDNVLSMTSITAADKKKIMIVASVARYSASYHDGGGINPKVWDKLRPSVCGSIAGAEADIATAVTLAVSANIASH